jgi:hypothetical protein
MLTFVSSGGPGMFYAGVAIKATLVHMLREYDFRLADEATLRTSSWQPIMPPHPTKLLIRRREL